jgi:hypothetical protein
MATSLERHIDLIIKYPRLAKEEISWIYKHWHDLKATQAEVSTLREDVAKHKRVANDLENSCQLVNRSLRGTVSALNSSTRVQYLNAHLLTH